MKTRFEKNLRITGDVMLYCHHQGAVDLDCNIREIGDRIEYKITASPVYLDDAKLEELKKRLSAPRRREVEQDYWELMGVSQDFSELTLVGMLSDEAEIVYEDYMLTITLLRLD